MNSTPLFRMSVKLPLLMFTMAVLAMLATGLVAYRVAKTALLDQAIARIEATTQARGDAVLAWVDDTLGDVAFQAKSPNVINALRAFDGAWASSDVDIEGYVRDAYIGANPHPATDRDLLEDAGDKTAYSRNHRKYHSYFQAIARKGGYSDVFLIGRDGAVMYSARKTDDFGRASTPKSLLAATTAAHAAPQGHAAMTRFTLDDTRKPVIEFAALIVDGGGNPMGTLVYRVPGTAMTALLEDAAAMASGGSVFLQSKDGILIASFGKPMALRDTSAANVVQPETVEISRVLSRDAFEWTVVTQKLQQTLIRPATEVLHSLIAQGAIVLAVMTCAGTWMGRGITGPLEKVRGTMARIATGTYDETVPETGRRDEIGDIARTLKAFQKALRIADHARADNQQKSSAMDASSAAMMILRPDGAIVNGNPALQDILQQLRLVTSALPEQGPPAWFPDMIKDAITQQAMHKTSCNMVRNGVSLTLTLDPICTETDDLIGWVLEWSDVSDAQMAQSVLATLDAYQIRANFAADGTLLEGNENWRRIMTDTHDPKTCAEIFEHTAGLDWSAIRVGAHWSGQLNLPTSFGLVVIQGSLSPVRDIDGTVRSILLLGADVTEASLALKAAGETRKTMEAEQAFVVDSLRSGLARLSRGDLTVTLETPFPKDYAQLGIDFNTATSTLAAALGDIAQSGATIRKQSEEVAEAAVRLASQSEKQAAALQQASTTLAVIANSAKTAALEAEKSKHLAIEATQNTEKHGAVLADAGPAMKAILASSKEIGDIVTVIDGIAFQTNLLALNAGVEAARAGPAGRGFAVVATEVRALAQRSSDAASQISELITASGVHVKNGVALFQDTGLALQTVGASVSTMSDRINGIATSGEEQSRAMSEINVSVSEIDRATQENAAMFAQTSEAGRILLIQSEALLRTLEMFTINHYSTVARFKAAG